MIEPNNINNQNKNDEIVQEWMAAFSSKAETEALKEFKEIEKKDNDKKIEEEPKKDPNKENLSEGKPKTPLSPDLDPSQETPKENYEDLYKKLKKDSEDKEKRANDNLRYSRQLSNTIGNVKNHIASLEENGEIDEDTANSLREIMNKHVEVDKLEIKEENTKLPAHLQEMTDLKNKARDALLKYVEVAPNSEVEQKYAIGFDNYFNMLNEEETKKMVSDLKKHASSPKDLLKEMLSIGKEFWETPIGKGLDEHGNFIDLVYARENQIESLKKEVESLKKKLSKETERDQSVLGSPGPAEEIHNSSYDAGSMMKRQFEHLGMRDAYNALIQKR